jgi:hypothetical protein
MLVVCLAPMTSCQKSGPPYSPEESLSNLKVADEFRVDGSLSRGASIFSFQISGQTTAAENEVSAAGLRFLLWTGLLLTDLGCPAENFAAVDASGEVFAVVLGGA